MNGTRTPNNEKLMGWNIPVSCGWLLGISLSSKTYKVKDMKIENTYVFSLSHIKLL